MAQSKFDRIFETRATPAAPPEITSHERHQEEPPPVPLRPVRSVGRPPGKRSDPAWKQFSVLLKKETQRQAANILREQHEGLDFSGLVQNLVESWIKKQKS
jgi:hypothetical protein